MKVGFDIRSIELPLDGLESIRTEAQAEGFRFIERLFHDWGTGQNRFAEEGEALVGAVDGEELIAICGINRDPYINNATVGRLRHHYVVRARRRSGVGRALVVDILRRAPRHFKRLRLRTDNLEASMFYLNCGFGPCGSPSATHERLL